MNTNTLDQFTRGYITAALWSSTGPAYGECPCCGRVALLDRLPEIEFEQQPMCSGDGCGVRELNSEPPLDENYTVPDLAPETSQRMIDDCARFQAENSETLAHVNYGSPNYSDTEKAGHDFWLTRNGHGAGFWDGDLPDEIGEPLTGAAKRFGEFNLYVGDDGKIYN